MPGLTRRAANLVRLDAGRPLARRDLLWLAGIVGLCLIVYLPYTFDGSLVTDDWEYARAAAFDHLDLGGAFHYIAWEGIRHGTYRPLGGFLDRGQHIVFGSDAPGLFIPLLVGVVVQSALLFVVLRQLRLRAPWAFAVAVVYALLPSVDTTRFWATASFEEFAVAAWLGGLACALQGLRMSRGPLALAWHVPAVLLYMIAVWLHEAVTPAIWLGGPLYVMVAGRRRSLWPWVAGVVGSSIAFFPMVGDASDRGSEASLGHMFDRVGDLFNAYAHIVFLDLPGDRFLGGPTGVALVLVAAIGAGIAIERREEAAGWLRVWGATGGLAALMITAGLAVFVPANDSYTPVWQGTGNRLSVAAAPGTAVLVVALCCLTVIGLTSLVNRPRWAAPLAAIIALLTAVDLGAQTVSSRGTWEQAQVEQARVIDAIERTIGGRVPPGNSVLIAHSPTVVPGGGPPIFVTPWDLNGALQLRYDDPTVTGRPLEPGAQCQRNRLSMAIDAGPGPKTFVYGRFWIVDVTAGIPQRISSRRECLAAVAAGNL